MYTRNSRLLARYWTRPNRDKVIKIESVVICLLDCANILLIGNFRAPYVTPLNCVRGGAVHNEYVLRT
jgi:hypothetical protein